MARRVRLTRYQRSQNAHWDLRKKHENTAGKKGDVLYLYHDHVLNVQKAKKKVLTLKERRKIFATVKKTVYKI